MHYLPALHLALFASAYERRVAEDEEPGEDEEGKGVSIGCRVQKTENNDSLILGAQWKASPIGGA